MDISENVIGLDIGGTKIYAARYDKNLAVQEDIQIPTKSEKGQMYVLAQLEKAFSALINAQTKALGISWAGFLDTEKGIIKKAPNILGFENFPLRDYFFQNYHLPCVIENDARLFALAEQKIYPKKESCLLGIIIGTGVGAGIIVKGEIMRGAFDFAGEIGHILLDQEKDQEAEDLFAGPALENLFRREMGINSLREVDLLWENESEKIQQIMEEVLEEMSIWIYNLLLTLNPGTIVFGGGVGKNFLPRFEESLCKKIQKRIDQNQHPLDFNLRFSSLSNAGAVGAAILAWQRVNVFRRFS